MDVESIINSIFIAISVITFKKTLWKLVTNKIGINTDEK